MNKNLSNLAYIRRALAVATVVVVASLGLLFLGCWFFETGPYAVPLARVKLLGFELYEADADFASTWGWLATRAFFWPAAIALLAWAFLPREKRYAEAVPWEIASSDEREKRRRLAEREAPARSGVLMPGIVVAVIGTLLNFGGLGYDFRDLIVGSRHIHGGATVLSGSLWVVWGFVAAAVAYTAGYAFGPDGFGTANKFRYEVLRRMSGRTSMASATFAAAMAALIGYQAWTSFFVCLGAAGFGALGLLWNGYWRLHALVFPPREPLPQAPAS